MERANYILRVREVAKACCEAGIKKESGSADAAAGQKGEVA